MANDTSNITRKISVSENTHAKNNEHAHVVNSIISSIGTPWKPNNALIKSEALAEFEENFSGFMQALNAAVSAEQAKVDRQIAEFKRVPRRVNLIMKSAAAQGLSPDFLENLRSTANRVNAVRVNKTTPDTSPDAPPPTEARTGVSVSRRSYAGILESLDLLDEQIKGNPDYDPHEPDYKPAAVSAWVENLRVLHNAALEAKVDTRTKRAERNAYVYDRQTGIIARMNAVKAYAETILDRRDPRLVQLKKLRFVDYSR